MDADDGAVDIKIRSATFENDLPAARDYYEALGRIFFIWGKMEGTFSMTLLSISHLEGALELGKLPSQWKDMLVYWRKAFSNIPELKGMKASALEIIPTLRDLVDRRHFLIHGTWGHFTTWEPPTALLVGMRQTKAGWLLKNMEVSLEHLHSFMNDVDRMGFTLIPFAWNASVLSNRARPTE